MADMAAEMPPSRPAPSPSLDIQTISNPPTSPTSGLAQIPGAQLSGPNHQNNGQVSAARNPGFHKRQRSSVNKLPEFSFNPAAFETPADKQVPNSFVSTFPASAQESPNRGRRHRRSASEFVGSSSLADGSSVQPIKVDFSGPTLVSHVNSLSLQHSPHSIVQQDGHPKSRTRGLDYPSEKIPEKQSTSGEEEYKDRVLDNSNIVSEQFELPSADAPASRVLFAETVEVIPRSDSDVHSDREDSVSPAKTDDDIPLENSTMRNMSDGGTRYAGDVYSPLRANDFSYFDKQPNPQFADTSFLDPLQVDGIFDNDPTGSETLDLGEANYYSPTATIATTPDAEPYTPRTVLTESEIIDLDQASTAICEGEQSNERGNPQGRNFQTARRSMHSSGATSGFVGPGMHYHRRAESAPLLTPISFERSIDPHSKNSGMENVFEEDEEDNTTVEQTSPPLEADEDADSEAGLGISVDGNDSKTMGIANKADRNRPSLLVTHGLSTHLEQTPSEEKGVSENDVEFVPPQAPFASPDTPSGSSFSSPKHYHFSLASSEPSLVLPHSTDDVPSLVSSRSTVASAAVVYQHASGLRSVTPRVSDNDRFRIVENHRKKRSSIVSLSRLIGTSYSDSKSGMDSDDMHRGPDTLDASQKARPARIKRLFALWRRKEDAKEG